MAKKILVVDDEKDIIEYLSSLLEDNGYLVSSACNGIDAMESIKADRPDLILLDLQMPEETGTGLYRKLRNKKDLRDIPIIIVSGFAGRNIAVSKSVVVLDKPLDQAVVLKEVEKAVS
ncbi:MAG: response regulator [Deltaproteobacteria bacterium]|nr:response regulator [Deltaproteobacteria bacterium]